MMAKFEGLPAEQKYGLIRKFLDKRIKENLLLRSLGSVQSMSDVEVIGTPNASQRRFDAICAIQTST
jgi:hypothetical protein